MNTVELLARQTEGAYDWTNQLLTGIPHDRWDIMPDIMESTISWQAGHLIMSFYFHSVMTIVGHQPDIMEEVPLREYATLYTNAAPSGARGKVSPQQLHEHLMLMESKSLEVIRALSPEDLEQPLEPTRTPHPIAKTKFEALDWNIKHTMWHCGQLGMLKRVVHERYDFGLQKV
ncbi:DinB family protein [Catalinimonas sp. 4WD22]|uniref:DinB family protein n=1 Tax=Catalinimonas locisalis TaxID=3133978 RepID=UPI003100B9E6